MDPDLFLFLFLSFLLWLFARVNGKKRPRPVRKRENIYAEPGTALQEQLEAYREKMADRAKEAAYEAERQAEEVEIRAEEQAEYQRQTKLPTAPQKPQAPIMITDQMVDAAIYGDDLTKENWNGKKAAYVPELQAAIEKTLFG